MSFENELNVAAEVVENKLARQSGVRPRGRFQNFCLDPSTRGHDGILLVDRSFFNTPVQRLMDSSALRPFCWNLVQESESERPFNV